MNVRQVLYQVHRYAGLALAIPMVLLALTGAILVFADEIDIALNPEQMIAGIGPQATSWEELARTAANAAGDADIVRLDLPRRPGGVATFITDTELEVFVDPSSGVVLGQRHEPSSWRHVVTLLHTDFLLPGFGVVVGAVTLAAALAVLVGLYLWAPKGRSPPSLWPKLRGPARGQLLSLHKVTGLYATLPLLVILLTGALFSFPEIGSFMLYRAHGDAPPNFGVQARDENQAQRISIDEALARAIAAAPATSPAVIALPHAAREPIRVQLRRRTEPYLRGATYVYLDPASGRELLIIDPDKMSMGARIDNWLFALHAGFWGRYFGEPAALATRFLWLLSCFVLTGLALTGAWTWFLIQKKRTPQQTQ
jgi:uncharacterized iron-regulated membrane protein